MKKIIAALTAIVIIAASSMTVMAGSGGQNTYSIKDNGAYDLFTSYSGGYSMLIDKGMAFDDSYAGIVSAFENDVKRIEVYKQDISSMGKEGYINYSDKFLSTKDHYNVRIRNEQIGGYNVTVSLWERNKLARVGNDKNFYASIEIPSGSYVYTVLIKSAQPIPVNYGYAYLVSGFRTFRPTQNGYVRKASAVDTEKRKWNDETLRFYNEYFGSGSELTWGIFEPDASYRDFKTLEKYEKYFEYDFPILLSYSDIKNTGTDKISKRLSDAHEHGKTLELTMQTTAAENNMVYGILNGEYDNYLYEYAKTVAEFSHPVIFRPFNEMNGDWCPYSSYNTAKDTMIYKELYRYIYSIFESCGANVNTIWVWNPNSVSFPDFEWNDALMYYPGDGYVDVVGLTAYNTGTYYSGETWKTFNELYYDMYRSYVSWFSQPFMITEFASASRGGDKAAWMRDMFANIKNYGNIKVAVWWDGCDYDAYGNIARSYLLDETPLIMKTFKDGIRIPWEKDIYA